MTDPAKKGNQKLYLQVKNKTKTQTGKQKQDAKWGIKQWKQNLQICWKERKERKERKNRYAN